MLWHPEPCWPWRHCSSQDWPVPREGKSFRFAGEHAFPQLLKNLPEVQETPVWFLGWEDPLEKGTATHSSILAWRIPWPVQSMGLQRVGHNWLTFIFSLSRPSVCKPLLHWALALRTTVPCSGHPKARNQMCWGEKENNWSIKLGMCRPCPIEQGGTNHPHRVSKLLPQHLNPHPEEAKPRVILIEGAVAIHSHKES